MKIPTNLTPIGPEMAFEMPDGEVLPMWVSDSDIEPMRNASTFFQTFHLLLMSAKMNHVAIRGDLFLLKLTLDV